MVFYVNVDERERIVAIAADGFHLDKNERKAKFEDELVVNGCVKITNEYAIPLYKLVNGVAVHRSQAEIDADIVQPVVDYSTDEILNALLGVE